MNGPDSMVSQNVIPSKSYFGGAFPFAFTENGIAMLSSVLNSKKAIEVNIAIMRTFTVLRKILIFHKDIKQELDQLRMQLADHDNNILLIFEYLKQFEQVKKEQFDQENRTQIGF
ncbi:MAG: hypothetical protein WCO63_04640 [Bacteroidota bacterium]